MELIKGFVMSLGMFSVIPVTRDSFSDRHMPLVIPSLPIVGMLIGFLWYFISEVLLVISMPHMIKTATLLFASMFLTGFIHVDGFMDTADAFFSHRDIETKKKILKDPNVGVFAVVAVIFVALFQFCSIDAITANGKTTLLFAYVPIVSRCVVGIATLNMKPLFESGYNASFMEGKKPQYTLFISLFAAAVLAIAWMIYGIYALLLLSEALVGVIAITCLYKHFKGMSGDLCGFTIVFSETAALICMALAVPR